MPKPSLLTYLNDSMEKAEDVQQRIRPLAKIKWLARIQFGERFSHMLLEAIWPFAENFSMKLKSAFSRIGACKWAIKVYTFKRYSQYVEWKCMRFLYNNPKSEVFV